VALKRKEGGGIATVDLGKARCQAAVIGDARGWCDQTELTRI
jgi:hypothetical protein